MSSGMRPGSAEYESIVAGIVQRIVVSAGVPNDSVHYGSTNRIVGSSGYWHQIDISVDTQDDLLLIECKYWNREIKPEAVLTLISRVTDIFRKAGKSVKGAIVTLKGVGPGAIILAREYGIEVQNVRSPEEFLFKYSRTLNVGLADDASASWADEATSN